MRVYISGDLYLLDTMDDDQLEDFFLELLGMAIEASDRHQRHGWAGGEAAYRLYQQENWNARCATTDLLGQRQVAA